MPTNNRHNARQDDSQQPDSADATEARNVQRDPDHWKTGNEPMTAAQASYLRTLSEEAGEPFDDSLSKADASKRIDELQAQTGRSPGSSQAAGRDGEHEGGQTAHSNLQRDPDHWKTGNEPMTAAQASYLRTLSEEAGEPFDDSLSKADASKRIDELQAQTGRGNQNSDHPK